MNSRMSRADDLRDAIGQFVDERYLIQFPQHGNTKWTPHRLAVTALLWSWSSQDSLTQRFSDARRIAETLLNTELPQCWQGFIKKLRADHASLKQSLMDSLRTHSQEISQQYPMIKGRPLLAVDGTRLELPRTQDNEQCFGTTEQSGQARSRPTAWLTLMWDVGSRTPWDWRFGATDSSERHHFQEMLDELPESSIITADAGFQGYDMWSQLLAAGHDLIIRVGGNVRLLHEYWEVIIEDDRVYLWPEHARQKDRPPLELRLLRVETDDEPMYLMTSILCSHTLTCAKAARIYRQRWGVELFFREHKQTFERERLRSHAARNVAVELDWSLMALWVVKLLGIVGLQVHDHGPDELSVKGALRAIRDEMESIRPAPEKNLFARLAAIKDDGYLRRDKRSRNYPRKKKRDKPPGPPRVRVMSDEQRNQLRAIRLRR